MTLLPWLSAFIPRAHAQIQAIGQGAPGVSEMWDHITSILPFSWSGESVPLQIVSGIGNIVAASIGFVAVAMVAYAGARISLAGFDEEGIAKAKSTLKNVAIGLIAAMLAEVAIYFVSGIIAAIAGA